MKTIEISIIKDVSGASVASQGRHLNMADVLAMCCVQYVPPSVAVALIATEVAKVLYEEAQSFELAEGDPSVELGDVQFRVLVDAVNQNAPRLSSWILSTVTEALGDGKS